MVRVGGKRTKSGKSRSSKGLRRLPSQRARSGDEPGPVRRAILDRIAECERRLAELDGLSSEGFVKDGAQYLRVGVARLVEERVVSALSEVERCAARAEPMSSTSAVMKAVAELELELERVLGTKVDPGDGPAIAKEIISEIAERSDGGDGEI